MVWAADRESGLVTDIAFSLPLNDVRWCTGPGNRHSCPLSCHKCPILWLQQQVVRVCATSAQQISVCLMWEAQKCPHCLATLGRCSKASGPQSCMLSEIPLQGQAPKVLGAPVSLSLLAPQKSPGICSFTPKPRKMGDVYVT